jgi:hypothetical protein
MRGLEELRGAFNDQLTGTVGGATKWCGAMEAKSFPAAGIDFEAGDGLTAVLTLDSIILGIVEDELRGVNGTAFSEIGLVCGGSR